MTQSLRGLSYADGAALLTPTEPVQAHGGDATGDVHGAAAHGVSGSGGALPHLAPIQHSFGHHDVSGVSAHVGGKAQEAASAMGAEAYATGDKVAFGSSPSLHTAAHEAAHVVQQRAGVSLEGGVGRSGDPYERHADAVADRVTRGESAADLLDTMTGGGGGAAIQRKGGGPKWLREFQTALGEGPADAIVTRAGKTPCSLALKKLTPQQVSTLATALADDEHLKSSLSKLSATVKSMIGKGTIGEVGTLLQTAYGAGWSDSNIKDLWSAWKSHNYTVAKMTTVLNHGYDAVAEALPIASKFTFGKPVFKGCADPATLKHSVTVNYGNPQKSVVVFVAEGDRGHYKGRHSYEEFALSGSNIKLMNTFFPAGTDLDAKGDAALNGAVNQLKAQFETDDTIARFELVVGSVTTGYERQVDGRYRQTQLFPASGGENVGRDALRVVRDLLKP